MFEAEGLHYITLWMEGEYADGEPEVRAEYEMSCVRWFRWDALPEGLFLPLANLVDGRCYPPERGGLGSLPASS